MELFTVRQFRRLEVRITITQQKAEDKLSQLCAA